MVTLMTIVFTMNNKERYILIISYTKLYSKHTPKNDQSILSHTTISHKGMTIRL